MMTKEKPYNDKGSARFSNTERKSRQPSTLDMEKEQRQPGTAGKDL